MNFLSSYPTFISKKRIEMKNFIQRNHKNRCGTKKPAGDKICVYFWSFMALSKRRLWMKLSKWDTDQDTKFRDGQLSDRFVNRIFCRTLRHVSLLRYCKSKYMMTSLTSPPLNWMKIVNSKIFSFLKRRSQRKDNFDNFLLKKLYYLTKSFKGWRFSEVTV